jgi:hypothetical protein
MKTYISYSVYDTTKEPINKIKAESLDEAIEKFAAMKKLDLDEFLSMFNVKVYGTKTNQTPV